MSARRGPVTAGVQKTQLCVVALDNIIVSPHSAGNTEESMFRMGATAAQNVVDCFNGKLNPENVINKEVL